MHARAQVRRPGKWTGVLAAALAGYVAVCVWISQLALHPPRTRVSDSRRPVVGLVLQDDGPSIRIKSVVAPAATAGLRGGDRIVALDGHDPGTAAAFAGEIARRTAGEVVAIEARRPGPDGDVAVLANVSVEVRAVSPADFGLPYEDVTFPGAGGRTLRGWFVAAPGARRSPAVAYGHGNAADRRQWLGVAPEVHAAGIGQLLFDFGGCGESDGAGVTLGALEAEDLRAALRWLAARPEVDPGRLALAGRSMGAVAAVLAADPRGGGPRIGALVLDSPYASLTRVLDDALRGMHLPPAMFRPAAMAIIALRGRFEPSTIRPVDVLAEIPADVLLVHGDRDTLVSFDHALELQHAAARGGRPDLTFVRLPGLGHGSPRPERYARDVARFLSERLTLDEHDFEIDRRPPGS